LRAARALIGGPPPREVARETGLALATVAKLETSGEGPALTARAKTLGRYVAYLENAGVRFLSAGGVTGVVLQQAKT
jgi:hypothetical protein